MIETDVKNFVEKYNLSGTFIVAFSGGFDSMCLLDILYKLKYDVIAVHLNHNWRGEESQCEAKCCADFAKSRNIKFYTETLPDDIEKTETAAREARYDFFKRCAEKFNSNVVFTAHNFNDNAETVLYRIIKGTGTIGLQGISEHREIFYRPLLKNSRAEIEQYIKKNNLTPNNDSSNSNPKYKRNFIRHKVLPLLKEINPNVSDALNSLSDIAREDDELINTYLPKRIEQASRIEQKRIIRQILINNNVDYNREKIENIQKFIDENKNSKSGKTLSLTNNLWFFASSKNIEVIRETNKNLQEVKITACGDYKFEDYTFSIEKAHNKLEKFPKDNDFKAFINIDKIDFTLRHRKAGDIIFPLGAGGHQKLKKYLNEKKIPNYQKDKIILLCNGNEVYWAAGLGLSEKIRVADNPTHVITLKRG